MVETPSKQASKHGCVHRFSNNPQGYIIKQRCDQKQFYLEMLPVPVKANGKLSLGEESAGKTFSKNVELMPL